MSSRELAAVSPVPAEARDRPAGPGSPRIDDPLAGLALEYTTRSLRFVTTRSSEQPADLPADARPTPVEVVLWFHSRIYFKTMRALVGKALTGVGAVDRFEDPRVCAKQTLAAVDRSRAALTQLRGEDTERTALLALLDAIARGIEERFPRTRQLALVSVSVCPQHGAGGNRTEDRRAAQPTSRPSRTHQRETIFRGTP